MTKTPDFGTLDLTNFSVGEMLRAGIAIRRAARGAETMEEAAQLVVRYLYEHCADPETGTRSCALVRFYKTHRYGGLDAELRQFAARQLTDRQPTSDLRCLALLASAGDEPAWNDRRASRGHRAIPLPSADAIRAAPMIMRLIEDIGIDVESVVSGADPARQGGSRNYDVFHVEDAVGSPYIPAQREFVLPYHIASVVGFGGLLRTGELFAVVLFSRRTIPQSSAARFKAIALDVRSSLFGYDDDTTWQG